MTIYPVNTPKGAADLEIRTGKEGTAATVHIPTYAAANAERFEIPFLGLPGLLFDLDVRYGIRLANPLVMEQIEAMIEKETKFADMNFH